MSALKENLPYRPCAGIMLLNKNGHVFVAKRIDTKAEAWQMPQGGIDKGEAPRDAAMRELFEETGVTQATIIAESEQWMNYDLPEHLIGKLWKGRYRGQTQKWFLMRFEGEDAQINIETEIPEFCEWRWVEAHLLPEIIVPFKRDLYAEIVKEFSPHLNDN